MGRLTVRATRGGVIESEHQVAWCRASAAGAESAPEAAAMVFARSAAKPFQALPAVRAGVIERFGLGDRHIAIGCSSHGGHDEHVAAAEEILAACGLDAGALQCGPGEPRDPAMAARLAAGGEAPSPLRHNCSGKHALALALCAAEHWPLESYLEPAHPLQEAMRRAFGDAARLHADAVVSATDGCGMRTYAVSLGRLAMAFARLASGGLGEPGDRIVAAMRAHPELVGFPGSIDTEIMAGTDGAVAKTGAEGVLAVGLPDGRGLAVKVGDGAMRALAPAGVRLLEEALGLGTGAPALQALARPRLVNAAGEAVGEIEAAA